VSGGLIHWVLSDWANMALDAGWLWNVLKNGHG
jgi:hypothetical protein